MRAGAYPTNGRCSLRLTTPTFGTALRPTPVATKSRPTCSRFITTTSGSFPAPRSTMPIPISLYQKITSRHFGTVDARLTCNFTVVATYAIGDIQRDLDYAHELSIFATVKF